jgi:hypothetical protein
MLSISSVKFFLRHSSGRLSAEQLTRDSAATSSLGKSPLKLKLQLYYMECRLYGMELETVSHPDRLICDIVK